MAAGCEDEQWYALLIGISDYSAHSGYSNIAGMRDDIELLRGRLVSKSKLRKENILVLSGQGVSGDSLRRAKTVLLGKIAGTDHARVLIYYGGHGHHGQLVLSDGELLPVDEFLVDFRNVGSGGLPLERARQPHIIFMADKCETFVAPSVEREPLRATIPMNSDGRIYKILASDPGRTASGGKLAFAFLDTLCTPGMNLYETFEAISISLQREIGLQKQRPQIHIEWGINGQSGSDIMFVPPVQHEEPPIRETSPLANDREYPGSSLPSPQIIGNAEQQRADVPRMESEQTLVPNSDGEDELRYWTPHLFIATTAMHFFFIVLWYCGVLRLQYSSRVSFNVMLVSFGWASLNHTSSAGLGCKWNSVERYGFRVVFPLHFALQSFGEWFIDGDVHGAYVTIGIAVLWNLFVCTKGHILLVRWRSQANATAHHRTFKAWCLLFVVVAGMSLHNVRLLWIATDVSIEWADKSFHLAQLLFVFVEYFTFMHNCHSAFLTEYRTMPSALAVATVVFCTNAALAGSKVEDGIWVRPEARNLILMCKYALLCAMTLIFFHTPRKASEQWICPRAGLLCGWTDSASDTTSSQPVPEDAVLLQRGQFSPAAVVASI